MIVKNMFVRNFLKVAIVIIASLAAGCAGSQPNHHDKPGESRASDAVATVTMTFRHPHATEENFEYSVEVATPDRQSGSGSSWQHTGAGCSNCLAEDGTTGDMRPRDQTSAYTYMVFEDVAYNGTWTIDLEWKYNNILGVWEGDQVGPFHLYPSDCVHVGFTEVNKTPRDGMAAASDCFEGGRMVVQYDGYNATFEIQGAP